MCQYGRELYGASIIEYWADTITLNIDFILGDLSDEYKLIIKAKHLIILWSNCIFTHNVPKLLAQ